MERKMGREIAATPEMCTNVPFLGTLFQRGKNKIKQFMERVIFNGQTEGMGADLLLPVHLQIAFPPAAVLRCIFETRILWSEKAA